jgi:DNA polymerase-3 subunit delta'
VPRDQLAAGLRARAGLEEAEADLLAAWSGGRVGWALRMIETPDELEARRSQLDALIGLAAAPRGEGFRWAEERARAYRGGEQADVFAELELWQGWWRDVLLVAAGCSEEVVHIDRRAELAGAAAHYRLADIHAFVARLDAAARQLRENVNPQLALENVMLHLPREKGGG